jgi:cyclophilin family peptidyl-prolyl cis-trans isomerase
MTALAALLAILAQGDPPRVGEERLILRTTMGDMVLSLFPDVAPKHVEQMLKLARLGVFDSSHFHRVEPGFVIQHAGHLEREVPLTAEQTQAIVPLPAEFSSLRHSAGMVSMAHEDGNDDSATTSFSILLADAPHLDGKYTVFGRLEAGYEVLRAIEATARDRRNRPKERVTITRAEAAPTWGALALPPPPRVDRPLMIAGAALAIAGLICSFIARAFMPRWARTISLLLVLVGVFLLLLAGAVASRGDKTYLLPVCLFVALMLLFRLMATFEAPHPPKTKAP